MYIEIYKEQANLNEPTIWEKKELWFLYGVCLIVSSSWIIYNIK
jgi:hypothetical protein